MLCYLNMPEAIQLLLRAGFTDAVIEKMLNEHEGVMVTTDRIRKNRRLLVERGECPAFEKRRCIRDPYAILRTHSEIRRYSPAMHIYCNAEQTVHERVDAYQLVMAFRTVTAQMEIAGNAKGIEINDLHALAEGWNQGTVCFRQCPTCQSWSLLAIDTPTSAERCPYCNERGITTGATWFSEKSATAV
ncbi:hypothetical protein [Vreelandella massiliensis]|uniref:hypothetical protein n=1 Tax=Vreelandella massiliensis TaxID=1816686 RepID=UPI00096A4325|nr:hypothetical protein [Halomonas massiliensis]